MDSSSLNDTTNNLIDLEASVKWPRLASPLIPAPKSSRRDNGYVSSSADNPFDNAVYEINMWEAKYNDPFEVVSGQVEFLTPAYPDKDCAFLLDISPIRKNETSFHRKKSPRTRLFLNKVPASANFLNTTENPEEKSRSAISSPVNPLPAKMNIRRAYSSSNLCGDIRLLSPLSERKLDSEALVEKLAQLNTQEFALFLSNKIINASATDNTVTSADNSQFKLDRLLNTGFDERTARKSCDEVCNNGRKNQAIRRTLSARLPGEILLNTGNVLPAIVAPNIQSMNQSLNCGSDSVFSTNGVASSRFHSPPLTDESMALEEPSKISLFLSKGSTLSATMNSSSISTGNLRGDGRFKIDSWLNTAFTEHMVRKSCDEVPKHEEQNQAKRRSLSARLPGSTQLNATDVLPAVVVPKMTFDLNTSTEMFNLNNKSINQSINGESDSILNSPRLQLYASIICDNESIAMEEPPEFCDIDSSYSEDNEKKNSSQEMFKDIDKRFKKRNAEQLEKNDSNDHSGSTASVNDDELLEILNEENAQTEALDLRINQADRSLDENMLNVRKKHAAQLTKCNSETLINIKKPIENFKQHPSNSIEIKALDKVVKFGKLKSITPQINENLMGKGPLKAVIPVKSVIKTNEQAVIEVRSPLLNVNGNMSRATSTPKVCPIKPFSGKPAAQSTPENRKVVSNFTQKNKKTTKPLNTVQNGCPPAPVLKFGRTKSSSSLSTNKPAPSKSFRRNNSDVTAEHLSYLSNSNNVSKNGGNSSSSLVANNAAPSKPLRRINSDVTAEQLSKLNNSNKELYNANKDGRRRSHGSITTGNFKQGRQSENFGASGASRGRDSKLLANKKWK